MEINDVVTYEDLVTVVKEEYRRNPRENGMIRLEWCDREDDEDLCREINLWTYWQGWKYAERKPEIRFLVLGQDWGCPNDSVFGSVLPNVRNMNNGNDIMYLYGCKGKESPTDKNLVLLFKEIGYDSIDQIRYPDLFFANFNMGYRVNNNSGGMTSDLLDADAPYVMKLIEILKPENILCLGETVSKATFKMLFGKNEKYSSYNSFVTTSKGFVYKKDDLETKIFPLFHTGHYGVNVNRKGGLVQQIKDWHRIIEK